MKNENKSADREEINAGQTSAPEQAEGQQQHAEPKATEPESTKQPTDEGEGLRNAFRKASGGTEGLW